MASPRDRSPSLARAATRGLMALGCGVALGGVSGCADEAVESSRAAAEQANTSELNGGQLARVHVIVQPQPDELEPEPQLQIDGHFVEYRGVSEALVRARANLPVPAWDQLVLGQCVASEALLPVEPLTSGGAEEDRELSMIDAGDLRVSLGNRELVAPVSLVPDILPWLSGVEYGHVDDRLPELAVEPDGTSPGLISVDGSPDGSIEPFSVPVIVPAQVQIEAAHLGRQGLTIDWRPPGDNSEFVVLRLQAFAGGEGGAEPVGEEITCLVADSGRADLALAPLVESGLATGWATGWGSGSGSGVGMSPEVGANAELLRVSISRYDLNQVRAGSFGVVDVIVELRVQATLALR